MKGIKRMLAMLVILTMVFGVITVAAESITKEADFLKQIGVLRGDNNGNLNLGQMLKRQDMMVMMSRLLGEEEIALKYGKLTSFVDVTNDYYKPIIGWAEDKGLTNGIGNNKFGYNMPLEARQLAAFMMRALGFTGENAISYEEVFKVAKAKGLFDGLSLNDKDQVSRGDMAKVAYNTIYAKMVDGAVLGVKLGKIKAEAENTAPDKSGPVTTYSGDWTIRKASVKPVLDGKLDDEIWNTSDIRILDYANSIMKGNASSMLKKTEGDISVKTKMLWDNDGIYMAFDVVDPDGFNNAYGPGQPLNACDTVQVCVDPLNGKDGLLDSYIFDFVPATNGGGPDWFEHIQYNSNSKDAGIVVKGELKKDGKGYIMEVLMPWSAIQYLDEKLDVKPGMEMGLAVMLQSRVATADPGQAGDLVDLIYDFGDRDQSGGAKIGNAENWPTVVLADSIKVASDSKGNTVVGEQKNSAVTTYSGDWTIRKASVKPVLDGKLDDEIWNKSDVRILDYANSIMKGKGSSLLKKTEGDISVKTKMLWDNDGIYMAFDVVDPDGFNNAYGPGQPLNANDTVQVCVDPLNGKDGLLDSYIFDFVPATNGGGPDWFEHIQYNSNSKDAGIVVKGELKKDGKGYIMEVFMPWSAIQFLDEKLEVKPGMEMGLAVMLQSRVATADPGQAGDLVDLIYDFGDRDQSGGAKIGNAENWPTVVLAD